MDQEQAPSTVMAKTPGPARVRDSSPVPVRKTVATAVPARSETTERKLELGDAQLKVTLSVQLDVAAEKDLVAGPEPALASELPPGRAEATTVVVCGRVGADVDGAGTEDVGGTELAGIEGPGLDDEDPDVRTVVSATMPAAPTSTRNSTKARIRLASSRVAGAIFPPLKAATPPAAPWREARAAPSMCAVCRLALVAPTTSTEQLGHQAESKQTNSGSQLI